MNEYAWKIINQEITQRKNTGNQLKFMDGNDLININKNLEQKWFLLGLAIII